MLKVQAIAKIAQQQKPPVQILAKYLWHMQPESAKACRNGDIWPQVFLVRRGIHNDVAAAADRHPEIAPETGIRRCRTDVTIDSSESRDNPVFEHL